MVYKICKKCGAKIQANSRYCAVCHTAADMEQSQQANYVTQNKTRIEQVKRVNSAMSHMPKHSSAGYIPDTSKAIKDLVIFAIIFLIIGLSLFISGAAIKVPPSSSGLEMGDYGWFEAESEAGRKNFEAISKKIPLMAFGGFICFAGIAIL